jgi:hypothetical protein
MIHRSDSIVREPRTKLSSTPLATPKLTLKQISEVSNLVAGDILAQRDKYAARAVPLSAQQRGAVAAFFSSELLGNARVLMLESERVANPEFYPMLYAMGFQNLPDQSAMAAITFHDVVVPHEPFSPALLFHELVHAEQYGQLGVPRFAELYVRGFLNGGSYEAIPLETNACALEDRFRRDPNRGFSVRQEVTK